MTATLDTSLVSDAVDDALKAHAPLAARAEGFWDSLAGDNAPFPYVRYQHIPGGSLEYTFGDTLSSVTVKYDVRAFARDTEEKTGRRAAAEVAALVKQALNGAILNVTGFSCLSCTLVADIPAMKEPDAPTRGKLTFSEGGTFEIVLAPAA